MTNIAIDRLCQLAMPPKVPLYNQGNWETVESELGVQLPEDYKRLIETFGQGEIVGQAYYSGLLIDSYLGGRPVERAKGLAAYFRSIDPLPYHVYPEQPGLLGFGNFGDKDTIAWHTAGLPNEWDIVYHDPETGFHVIKGMGTLEFVISVLEESSPLHKNSIIRMGHMKGPHTFVPEP